MVVILWSEEELLLLEQQKLDSWNIFSVMILSNYTVAVHKSYSSSIMMKYIQSLQMDHTYQRKRETASAAF